MNNQLNSKQVGIAIAIAVLLAAIIGWKVLGPQSGGHVSGGSGNAAYDEYQRTGKMPSSYGSQKK